MDWPVDVLRIPYTFALLLQVITLRNVWKLNLGITLCKTYETLVGWNPHGVAFIHFGRGIRLHLAPSRRKESSGSVTGCMLNSLFSRSKRPLTVLSLAEMVLLSPIYFGVRNYLETKTILFD